jgi:glycosyltransferase involved in cell wall biosynthesis
MIVDSSKSREPLNVNALLHRRSIVLSIVVPMYNEEASVGPLLAAVRDALVDMREPWELLLVDDGSQDGTVAAVVEHALDDERIRLVRLARNFGQSAAMQAGFDQVRGDVIVTMDGDLQNDPRDIPLLTARLRDGWDIVAGYRERRQDFLVSRRLPSQMANALLRRATGVSIRDTGCSLKAYRREVIDRLQLYSDFHRFIPALAVAVSGARITEMPVRHHARQFGQSKYGISRVFKVMADLITLIMLRRFRERPLQLFSFASLAAFLMGGLAAAVAVFTDMVRDDAASGITMTAVATCLVALSGFLFLAGFAAETMLHTMQENEPVAGSLLTEIRI